MDIYNKLIKQCGSNAEKVAIKDLFVKIQCILKHERLRKVYNENCLNCGNSFSIPTDDSENGIDELFCSIKQKIVNERKWCNNHN